MEKSMKDHYINRLLEEKKNLEEILIKMDSKDKKEAMEDYYSELSFYDNHPADLGTEIFMMEQDKGLKNKIRNTILEIEQSLEKIKDNTFGLCDICGSEIDKDRLELIPYVKFCTDCAKQKNSLDKNDQFRPVEEKTIEPFYRVRKNVEFDDEDSYQALARFNEIKKDPSFSTGDNQGVFDEVEKGIVEDVEKISEDYYKDSLE